MLFHTASETEYKSLGDGLFLKPLIYGKEILAIQFKSTAGSVHSMHNHPNEQLGFIISGRVKFTVDGESFEVGAGDSYCIPGDAMHQGEVLEDVVGIETYAPPRDDYKALFAGIQED